MHSFAGLLPQLIHIAQYTNLFNADCEDLNTHRRCHNAPEWTLAVMWLLLQPVQCSPARRLRVTLLTTSTSCGNAKTTGLGPNRCAVIDAILVGATPA